MIKLPAASSRSRRSSAFDTDELVSRIHASKPKSVFLEGEPKATANRAAFGKKSKIGVTEQGLQSIKRAAYAIETSDEVKNILKTSFFFIFSALFHEVFIPKEII